MAKEYITIQKLGNKEDEMWRIKSKRTVYILGNIDRYRKWNRLVFVPEDDTLWTSECLQQIVDFLKEQENEI